MLHDKSDSPAILPVGKIAGIDEMVVVKSEVGKGEESFLARMLQGNVLVHFVRSISYFIIFAIAVSAIALSSVGINALFAKRNKRVRRKRAERLFSPNIPEKGSVDGKLLDMYVERGSEALDEIKGLIEDEDKLLKQVKRHRIRVRKKVVKRGRDEEIGDELAFVLADEGRYIRAKDAFEYMVVDDLVNNGFVKVEGRDKVVVDAEFKESFEKLLKYLRT